MSGPAVASTSSNNEEEVSISSPTVQPEDISPFPKAGSRKRKGGRKKGKSLILTDTPVKEQLRAAQENRKQNKGTAKPKSGSKPKKLKLNGEDGKRKTEDDGDSENGEHEEWLASDHDQASESDEHEEQQMEDLDLPEADDLKPDDFVLVKFSTKKNQVLYAGQIQRICAREDEEESVFDVRFLRLKTPKAFTFVFPTVNDTSEVPYEDVMGRLPKPRVHGGTARVTRQLIFPVDLDCYSDVLR